MLSRIDFHANEIPALPHRYSTRTVVATHVRRADLLSRQVDMDTGGMLAQRPMLIPTGMVARVSEVQHLIRSTSLGRLEKRSYAPVLVGLRI